MMTYITRICCSVVFFIAPDMAAPAWDDVPKADAAANCIMQVRVLYQNQPVSQATVGYRHNQPRNKGEKPIPAVKTDSNGLAHFNVTLPEINYPYLELFAEDATGRIGHGTFLAHIGKNQFDIHLLDVGSLDGMVKDQLGKPISGATFSISQLTPPPTGDASRSSTLNIPPSWIDRYTVKTDAQGRLHINSIPIGYRTVMKFKAEGFGDGYAIAEAGATVDLRLTPAGAIQFRFIGGTAQEMKGVSWNMNMQKGQPRSSDRAYVIYNQSGIFEGTDPFVLKNVSQGEHALQFYPSLQCPFELPAATKVYVEAGKTTEVAVELKPAAKVTGRIVNRASGDGIEGIPISIAYVIEGNRVGQLGQVKTDKAGQYTAYVPTGKPIRAVLFDMPRSYHEKQQEESLGSPPSYTLKAGQTQTLPEIELERSAVIEGVVVDQSGKPLPDVQIQTPFLGLRHASYRSQSDAKGKFRLDGFAPDPAMEMPRFRQGLLVNQPMLLDLDKPLQPLRVVLSDTHATRLEGQVMTHAGKPIAGAEVTINWSGKGSGRYATWGSVVPIEKIITQSDGTFITGGLWGKDQYRLTVKADGYGSGETNYLHGTPGKTTQIAPIKLARMSAMVKGVVKDSAGKPLGGVTLLNSGDGPIATSTTSAADGSFALTGYYETKGFVFARKEGYRLTHVQAQPDGPAVMITLKRTDESADVSPGVTAEHRNAVDAMTRHLLTSLWNERKFLGGYERNTFVGMAAFDPKTAQKWMDDEPKGKDAYAGYLKQARRKKTLFDLAKTDMEEAIELLREATGRDSVAEMTDLASQLLPIDKNKALRVIEEATLLARTLEAPRGIWSLAQVGSLAEEAGQKESGKKLILEAANQAEKTGNEGMDTLARGYAARYLAKHDLPRALKLIEPIRNTEHNRWLMHVCYELAPLDIAKTKELFSQFIAETSYYPQHARMLVALRIAVKQPDEAEKLVDGITEQVYRVMGFSKLAVAIASHDKPRAHRLIKKARAEFEKHNTAFQGWGNMGGKPVAAALLLIDAQQTDYPEMSELLTWALMQRPSTANDAYDARNRDEQILKQAMLLSFVDSAIARQALEALGSPSVLAERATRESREWLFTLAVTMPEAAQSLIDRQIKKVHDQPNELSRTGMIELISILTERRHSRIRELQSYASMPRFGEEPD